jgi:ribosomal protein L37AE/L43A
MFQTPNVPAFMQKASIEGRKDKKVIRFTFYITPIKHALAAEISPAMADRLFKFDPSQTPHPVTEMDSPHFNLGKIDLQFMILNGSDDPKMSQHGTMLQSAQISHISARKLFLPDNPDFSLIFRVEVPFDDIGFDMVRKFYDEKLFLTFEPMQLMLGENQIPQCEECENPAVCRDSMGNYFCEADRKKSTGEVTYIVRQESPAEKEAREAEERKDTSHINRKKK